MTLFFSLVLTFYGYIEARNPVIERFEIRDSKVMHNFFRIVQISDLHAGVMTDKKRLEKVFNMIRDNKPDILVTTGDFIDRYSSKLDEFCSMLASFNPPYGKYAVLGNHELYAGIDESIRFLNACGFEVLRGYGRAVSDWFYIAGVDDRSIVEAGLATGKTEDELLIEIPPNSYAVLLKHRPIPAPCGSRSFSLQISGHTHAGQIFPFNFVTSLFFPLHAGNYEVQCGMFLHVSRGTGTWGPPIRLFSTPEISIIDLLPEGNDASK
ncbi:MAG: metallophosphoesterase [Syntrophales bacterium]|nr:metallophosphoesterase [Syntrophales bacterium]